MCGDQGRKLGAPLTKFMGMVELREHAVQLAPTRSSDGICGWMGGKVIREFVRGMIYDKPEANIHTGERIVQQIRAKNFPFCFREHVVETLTTE